MIRDLIDAKTRYSSVFFRLNCRYRDVKTRRHIKAQLTISMNRQLFKKIKKEKKIALSIFLWSFNDSDGISFWKLNWNLFN